MAILLKKYYYSINSNDTIYILGDNIFDSLIICNSIYCLQFKVLQIDKLSIIETIDGIFFSDDKIDINTIDNEATLD
jgi:hypothetical protein